MKFKDWLNSESIVGTSVLNGGIGEAPNDGINTNLPVRSRFSTVDGTTPKNDENALKEKPEMVFGFKTTKDRKDSKNRISNTIDIGKRFPLNTSKAVNIGGP